MKYPTCLIAAIVLAACGGGDPPAKPARDAAAVARPPIDAGATHVSEADALYKKYCALCHGPDAKGYAADNAPSLVNETFLATASDAFLTSSIATGRPGTAMAGYGRKLGGPLSDAEIATLVKFLRSKGPAALPLPEVSQTGDPRRGKVIYDKTCKVCHGDPAARGDSVHLANPAFLAAASDPFLRHAIVHGRPGTKMEPFAGKLDDAQIDDVVALLRSWRSTVAEPPPRKPPPEPPRDLPIVINPKGKAPAFTLREDRFVAADQVKKALDDGRRMVILDARPTSEWLRAHIPGAIPAPYYQDDKLEELPKDGTWIIAYCACPHHASGVVVDELRKRGFTKTAVLDEGILVWQQRKYPIDGDPNAPAPPPQDHTGHSH